MKKIYLAIGVLLIVTLSCSSPKVHKSGIDPQIQEAATSVLQEQLPKVKADSGLIMVMDVKTGRVMAKTSMMALPDSTLKSMDSEVMSNVSNEPGSIFLPIGLLACLEKGRILMTDSVETGRGLYKYNGESIVDPNYFQGGYGKITREQTIVMSSNIGIFRTVEEVFGDSIANFICQLKKMSIGEPLPENVFKNKSSFDYWLSLGFEIKLSPIQIITFYNAIANNGKMVYDDKILNYQIAHETTIKSIQKALEKVVSHSIPDSIQNLKQNLIAGKSGRAYLLNKDPRDVQLEPFEVISFCGYFPLENPKYTSLVIFYLPKERFTPGRTSAFPIYQKVAEKVIELDNVTSH